MRLVKSCILGNRRHSGHKVVVDRTVHACQDEGKCRQQNPRKHFQIWSSENLLCKEQCMHVKIPQSLASTVNEASPIASTINEGGARSRACMSR